MSEIRVPVSVTVSSKEEIDELASELADDYIDYLNIDVTKEKSRLDDSIEECLAHLEELISALDIYKQKEDVINEFISTVASKRPALVELYEQIDSMEQYVFETNKLLNGLEQTLRDLEHHKVSGLGKIKQIIGIGIGRFFQ